MPKKRRKDARRAKKVMKIYCEGAATEPKYIERYIECSTGTERRFVISIEPTRKNTPVQLVDVACDAKSGEDVLPGDEFWVVYDRESPAKYSEELHDKARGKAEKNGVHIALSNVCFEYWLLLHFVNTSAPYSSCENLLKESDFKKLFKDKSGSDYEKSATIIYDTVRNGVDEARNRAQKLNAASAATAGAGKIKLHNLNPYTDVYKLLDAIDKFK